MIYLAVAFGGGLGAVSRYAVSLVLLHAGSGAFPWATLLVNLVGSFIIGLFQGLTGPDGRILARPATRQFVKAGFCGGLTTFSIFSVETVVLITEGEEALAALNVALSLLLWVPAVGTGALFARYLNRLRQGAFHEEV